MGPSRRSLRGLDFLAFFSADVQAGVGPFLAIYLEATCHWDPANIGLALSAAGLGGLCAQTPVGGLVDRMARKRELVVIAAFLIALGCLVLLRIERLSGVLTTQALLGAAETFFPPTIAAISLGLVGHTYLDRRIGRNESFNHAGNVAAALLAGLTGYYLSQSWIFYSVVAMSMASIASALVIRSGEIDYELARGGLRDADDGEAPAGFRELLKDRRLAVFALSVVLFHFANAAMLPLVGMRLSEGKPHASSLFMGACIVIAQMVMVPVAAASGRLAGTWGRKAVFLVGFGILPIRGFLYTLSGHPSYLMSVQLLDGIGAGIFGVVSVLIVADLTKGTGRFNVTRGAIATAQGIGASLSTAVAGWIARSAGYSGAFLALAAVAAIAFVVFSTLMPETKLAEARP
jgi:predicted MFS family arabinose efflux permease